MTAVEHGGGAAILVLGAEATGRAVAAAAMAVGVRVELLDDDQAALACAQGLFDEEPGIRLVVDATADDIHQKRLALRALDQLASPHVPIVSATACHPVSSLSTACHNPERVLAMSTLSGASPVRLLELLPSQITPPRTTHLVAEVFQELGYRTVVCKTDTPGFISGRLVLAMLVESARLVQEGVCTPDEVDLVAKGMYRHSSGPFEAVPEGGFETAAAQAAALAAHYGDQRFAAGPLLSLIALGAVAPSRG